MRGNEFLDKMELIDPSYIEAADAAPKARKKLWTGWRAAVAACLCLILLAGTAAAAVAAVSESGTWLIEVFAHAGTDSDHMGAGYKLGAEVRKFPVSELSVKMQAVGEEIERQVETYSSDNGQKSGIGNLLDWIP